MENKNLANNGRCHMIGRVMHLETIGGDFIKSALLLYETKERTHEWSDYIYTFNLLASQALEILPKSIIATRICLEKNHKSIEEINCAINRELECLSHKLDNIFNEAPELKKALSISNIERFNTEFVDEFCFTINKSSKEKKICIKNLEAARYGVFAREKDIISNYNKDTVDFLKNLMTKTAEIRIGIIKEFDNKSGIKC